MAIDDHGERLAVVETKLDTMEASLFGLQKGQADILAELTKYKGAIGLATFVISCVIAAASLLRDWVINHWR
jgi:hypothetical protein